MNTAGPFAYLAGNQNNHAESPTPDKQSSNISVQLRDIYKQRDTYQYRGSDGFIKNPYFSQTQLEDQMANGYTESEDDLLPAQNIYERQLLQNMGYDTVDLAEYEEAEALNHPFAFSAKQLEEHMLVRYGMAEILERHLIKAKQDGMYFPIVHAHYKHAASSWMAAEILVQTLRDNTSPIKVKVCKPTKSEPYSRIRVSTDRNEQAAKVSDIWLHYAKLFLTSGNQEVSSASTGYELVTGDIAKDIIVLAGYSGIKPDDIFAKGKGQDKQRGNVLANLSRPFQQVIKDKGYDLAKVRRAYEETYAVFRDPFYNRAFNIAEHWPVVIPKVNPSPAIDFHPYDMCLESHAYEYVTKSLNTALTPFSYRDVVICNQPTAVINSVAGNYIFEVISKKKKKVRSTHRREADILHGCNSRYDSSAITTVFMSHSLFVLPASRYKTDKAQFYSYGHAPEEDNMDRLARIKDIKTLTDRRVRF